jgi:fucokinase
MPDPDLVECPFDAIVVTACHEKQAAAYRAELAQRQAFKGTLVLAVADPQSRRIGSGGGTINALVAVAEALTKKSGNTEKRVDEKLVANSTICIIHCGGDHALTNRFGDSQRSSTQSVCGKGWSALNSVNSRGELLAPIDLLLETLSRLFHSSPKGLIVASCDVMLLLPDIEYDWSNPGVTGLAIPMDLEFGPRHGAFKMATDGTKV